LSSHRLACNQVPYNLSDRQIESDLVPYCTGRQIAVVGYSPFGHDYFPSLGSTQGQLLADIGRRHGKTPRQVVLNYLTRHPNTFAIPKARHPEHVRENSGGAGWSLTEQDIAAIEQAFPV
jgi:diketogulonate reductase-like aldo/keto reductase